MVASVRAVAAMAWLALALAACVPPTTAPSPTAAASASPPIGAVPIGETERALVVRVVDGDTIVVDRGAGNERVRYIGIDAPESVRPDSPVEPMGREAAAANEALVAGREVILERDVGDRDRFGRLLRYVWVEDPSSASGLTLVNLALVEDGFARAVTFPPDVRYVDLYLAAARRAREQGLGLWADDAASP